MFNLIRRDLILQKVMILTFIPFIIFFVVMGSHPILTFFLASVFIPFNAYAYDERSDVNILLNSLPYTRKEIIAARYVGALIYMILACVLVVAMLLLFGREFVWTDLLIGGTTFLVFSAFTFPLFYVFKQGYITAVLMGSVIVGAGVGPIIVRFLADYMTAITTFIMETPVVNLSIAAAGGAIILYLVSWGFTTAVYQRKAF